MRTLIVLLLLTSTAHARPRQIVYLTEAPSASVQGSWFGGDRDPLFAKQIDRLMSHVDKQRSEVTADMGRALEAAGKSLQKRVSMEDEPDDHIDFRVGNDTIKVSRAKLLELNPELSKYELDTIAWANKLQPAKTDEAPAPAVTESDDDEITYTECLEDGSRCFGIRRASRAVFRTLTPPYGRKFVVREVRKSKSVLVPQAQHVVPKAVTAACACNPCLCNPCQCGVQMKQETVTTYKTTYRRGIFGGWFRRR